jgi:hypothetical protein
MRAGQQLDRFTVVGVRGDRAVMGTASTCASPASLFAPEVECRCR